MKRYILLSLLVAFASLEYTQAKPHWWALGGDFRLAIGAGVNIPQGDVSFTYADFSGMNAMRTFAENPKYKTIGLNAALTFGWEWKIDKTFSWGLSNMVAYQKDAFTFDMSDINYNFQAEGEVNSSGIAEYLDIYFSLYPTNKFSINLGPSVFYDLMFSSDNSLSVKKGESYNKSMKNPPFSVANYYNMGIGLNGGATFHITNNVFMNLSVHYNMLSLMTNSKNWDKLPDEVILGAASSLDVDYGSMNYFSDGLWYEREPVKRLTAILSIGYRF